MIASSMMIWMNGDNSKPTLHNGSVSVLLYISKLLYTSRWFQFQAPVDMSLSIALTCFDI